MGSAAAGLAQDTLGGAYYLLNLQPDFPQKGKLSLVSLEELASSADASSNNVLSYLCGSQPLSSIFPCLALVTASNCC